MIQSQKELRTQKMRNTMEMLVCPSGIQKDALLRWGAVVARPLSFGDTIQTFGRHSESTRHIPQIRGKATNLHKRI